MCLWSAAEKKKKKVQIKTPKGLSVVTGKDNKVDGVILVGAG